MSFNSDLKKPPIEIVFATKTKPIQHSSLISSDIVVKGEEDHKYLVLSDDKRLSINSHIKAQIKKADKGFGTIKGMSKYALHSTLVQVYKSHVRSHLEYCGTIFHQPPSDGTLSTNKLSTFMQNLESV